MKNEKFNNIKKEYNKTGDIKGKSTGDIFVKIKYNPIEVVNNMLNKIDIKNFIFVFY